MVDSLEDVTVESGIDTDLEELSNMHVLSNTSRCFIIIRFEEIFLLYMHSDIDEPSKYIAVCCQVYLCLCQTAITMSIGKKS